jgi:hypothetical protein
VSALLLCCLSGIRIEKQDPLELPAPTVGGEVEHVQEGTSQGVEGLVADLPELPVVLDKAQDRTLICHRMSDKILFGERRNYQEGKPGPYPQRSR